MAQAIYYLTALDLTFPLYTGPSFPKARTHSLLSLMHDMMSNAVQMHESMYNGGMFLSPFPPLL